MAALTFFTSLVALTALPSLNANPTPLDRRYQLSTRAIPAGWSSLGCYTDNVSGRTLTGSSTTFPATNSIETCIAFCSAAGSAYAGLEYTYECFCGDAVSNGGVPAAAADCSFTCPGDPTEKCGAASRLNLYWNGGGTPPPPPPPPLTGTWAYVGCYTDDPSSRTLTGSSIVDRVGNSVESCTAYCQEGRFEYAGVEYESECWCGNALSNGGAPAPEAQCFKICPGNPAEKCGAQNRMNLYHLESPPPPPPSNCFVCPPQDLAGRPLLEHTISQSQLFCRYQSIPNDFFCKYFQTTGLLKQDHDDGFCPPVASVDCSAV